MYGMYVVEEFDAGGTRAITTDHALFSGDAA